MQITVPRVRLDTPLKGNAFRDDVEDWGYSSKDGSMVINTWKAAHHAPGALYFSFSTWDMAAEFAWVAFKTVWTTKTA